MAKAVVKSVLGIVPKFSSSSKSARSASGTIVSKKPIFLNTS